MLLKLSPEKRNGHFRNLCLTDLYWLIRYGLGRADLEHAWLFDRCREVQANPDGRLDLWAREHYKSTIITFGLTIQDVLNNPDVTVGIFSHTRPIAKGFLRQIKREFESNDLLKGLFPDVLWANPAKEAPKWSEDDGIILKRKTNPKEATIEAWGLVDGQPTSKHFGLMVYDDIVTRESVTTPDMIAKTTEALELSYNLGAEGGRRRFVGTRYHYNDSYKTISERGSVVVRKYAGTEDGTDTGVPVLWTPERLKEKRRDMGPYTFASQILLDPKGDNLQGFKRSWLKYYHGQNDGGGMNKYMLVDPASEKKKGSDFTVIWVVGLSSDSNYYILDCVRDRLNLTERAERVMRLHRRWRPLEVRYEKYGMQADIEHLQHVQAGQNYRFDVLEVGGQTAKADRIKRLVPLFEQGRVYLPETLHMTDFEGIPRDLVSDFVEQEYAAFPVGIHDDMLDALARIAEPEMPLVWPIAEVEEDRYSRRDRKSYGGQWAA